MLWIDDYYMCRMFSIISNKPIEHGWWADADLMLSQRCRRWTGIELALVRHLCVHWDMHGRQNSACSRLLADAVQ